MPTFSLSDSEVTVITKYFLALSNQEIQWRYYQAVRPDPMLVKAGGELFTKFKCLSCHQLASGAGVAAANLAPNLTMARERLKPEWIIEWLTDPQILQENTKMPNFFGSEADGHYSPDKSILNGDWRKQIEALRDYLLSIGKSNVPAL
jgi:mono/diheme cytochrome c family protein